MLNKYNDMTCSPNSIVNKWLFNKEIKYYLYFVNTDLYRIFVTHFDKACFHDAKRFNSNIEVNNITAETLYAQEGSDVLFFDKREKKIGYGNIKDVSYDAYSEIISINDENNLAAILNLIDEWFQQFKKVDGLH